MLNKVNNPCLLQFQLNELHFDTITASHESGDKTMPAP